MRVTIASSTFVDADAGLGGGEHRVVGGEADDVLDFLAHLVGLGGGQVDLVDDGNDGVVMLDRLVDVSECLRLHPLRRVHNQQRAFARGEAARHLVGEVDVAGRVHQVQRVGPSVLGGVVQAHRLRLDGNAAFALDIHVIEHLLAHLAVGQAAGRLDQPVGQCGLAVIDMRDDGEVADQR
jgi:hypothetical protein